MILILMCQELHRSRKTIDAHENVTLQNNHLDGPDCQIEWSQIQRRIIVSEPRWPRGLSEREEASLQKMRYALDLPYSSCINSALILYSLLHSSD